MVRLSKCASRGGTAGIIVVLRLNGSPRASLRCPLYAKQTPIISAGATKHTFKQGGENTILGVQKQILNSVTGRILNVYFNVFYIINRIKLT